MEFIHLDVRIARDVYMSFTMTRASERTVGECGLIHNSMAMTGVDRVPCMNKSMRAMIDERGRGSP